MNSLRRSPHRAAIGRAMPAPGLRRRWIVAFTLGELIGFGGIPVVGGISAYALTMEMAPAPRAIVLYLTAIVGGAGEGAVLGMFQYRVLRDQLPALDRRWWLFATAAGGAIAWACGMLAPTLDDILGLTPLAQVAIWLPASIVILLSIGVAQSLVLRNLAVEPWRWARANALAWLAGLPWTFVLPALVPESSPPAAWIATFVVAGVLMGATAGWVTSRYLPKPLSIA